MFPPNFFQSVSTNSSKEKLEALMNFSNETGIKVEEKVVQENEENIKAMLQNFISDWKSLKCNDPLSSDFIYFELLSFKILSRTLEFIKICEKDISDTIFSLCGCIFQYDVKNSLTLKTSIESGRCLANLYHQSEVARTALDESSIIEFTVKNLNDEDHSLTEMILRLIFLMTCFKSRNRRILLDRDIIGSFNQLFARIFKISNLTLDEIGVCQVSEEDSRILQFILKIVFSLFCELENEKSLKFEDSVKDLGKLLRTMMLSIPDNICPLKLMLEICQTFIILPPYLYDAIIPRNSDESFPISVETSSEGFPKFFRGYDTKALGAILWGITKLEQMDPDVTQKWDALPGMLHGLSKLCQTSRVSRRYLRSQILPPLRDVDTRPEISRTLRGFFVRLMRNLNQSLNTAASIFLFTLCKENVNRLIKYTGLGNSIGFLNNNGILSNPIGFTKTGNYSSSSEDSETEEYISRKNLIDSVTGCVKTSEGNPILEEMTEEEKEKSEEELMKAFQRLENLGVLKLARVLRIASKN